MPDPLQTPLRASLCSLLACPSVQALMLADALDDRLRAKDSLAAILMLALRRASSHRLLTEAEFASLARRAHRSYMHAAQHARGREGT